MVTKKWVREDGYSKLNLRYITTSGNVQTLFIFYFKQYNRKMVLWRQSVKFENGVVVKLYQGIIVDFIRYGMAKCLCK